MPNRFWDDDPTIPPPGCRTGHGSGSILPYLVKSLAAKPREGHETTTAQQPPRPPEPVNEQGRPR